MVEDRADSIAPFAMYHDFVRSPKALGIAPATAGGATDPACGANAARARIRAEGHARTAPMSCKRGRFEFRGP